MTKTSLNWFDSVLIRVFWFCSVFSGLAWFFLFRAYKTKTEPVGFLKILIGLVDFFSNFF